MAKLQLGQALTKLRKIRIQFNLGKAKQVAIPPPPPKPIPRGLKAIEKYPLYEPFAHAVIVQNPKTGEYKYILDELNLDPLERTVYNRILDILIAEIESPKEEITDPRRFFAEEAKKKSLANTASASDGSQTFHGTRFFYHAEKRPCRLRKKLTR